MLNIYSHWTFKNLAPSACQRAAYNCWETGSWSGEAGAYFQPSLGENRDTPWTGHHSITGQHRDTQEK
ncbi:hypothetical protein AMECASPLE_030585 [Ameca splendens]|uniref:Uncharacterized protein n=1 Tax=Ameca splendens TaxID=208324 RepID=A0ABV0ZFW8_9TELE